MPEISRFFGVAIRMFFNDHHPPHFHATYAEDEALIELDTLTVLRGRLPRRAIAMVREWAILHAVELRRDWALVQRGLAPQPIEPLE